MAAVTCKGMFVDCPTCVEQLGAAGAEHECDDLCELIGYTNASAAEFHRQLHKPYHCRRCRALLDDRRGRDLTVGRLCRYRTCMSARCPYCKAEQTSVNRVGCPACCPVRRPTRVAALRHAYGRRRGHHRARRRLPYVAAELRDVTAAESMAIARAIGDPMLLAGHPLTCNGGNPDFGSHHDDEVLMQIGEQGLVCPECGRVQELPRGALATEPGS